MKTILICSMVFVSFVSYGQDAQRILKNPSLSLKQKSRPFFDMILYYGTKDKIGFDFNYKTKRNFILGFGGSWGFKGGIGKDYTKDLGPFLIFDDIYETNVKGNIGVYGSFGYAFDKFTIGTKLGFATFKKYFNAYQGEFKILVPDINSKDFYKILVPNGNYFTSEDAGSKVLSGVFMSYKLNMKLSPYVGYDNFNGVNLGISYSF